MPSVNNWWIIGGICFIVGIIALLQGEYRSTIELMGTGLVLIAVADEDLRNKLTDLFYSIYRGLLRIVSRS